MASSSHTAKTNIAVRTLIKLLLMAVYLGIVVIWIMAPTNTYRQNWLLRLKSKFNFTTYFGSQGTTLLIYTFPIIFIAVAGCVYLHLGKKSNDNKLESSGKKDPLALWKRPMLVKGPLGIVSSIELTFFMMFIALLVWSLSTYLHNKFAAITPQSAAEEGEKVWEAKLVSTGLTLGVVGNICLTLLFFPVARGSSVLPLFGLTSEASIKYHMWVGHMVMTLLTAHGVCFIISFIATNAWEIVNWPQIGISNLAGELSLLSGLAMWATTFTPIRRKFFELFFYTHYLYILFVVFFVFHVGVSYSCIMLPGFYLFLVDRFLRFLQSRQRVRLLSARLLPCETVELNFSKAPGLSYNPTSIMFVNVPSISKLQWHPFTITSNSNLEPEKISVVIKGEGSWSKKLYQLLSSHSSIDRLEVSVEGPYGPVSTHFLRHDTLVMVSGGSGITPFISIIRELIFASTVNKSNTPQIILICSFKNSSDLTMLDLLLPMVGTPSELSNLKLRIEAYVTREKQPTTENSKLLRAIWFKPRATDAPISSILGPNSWLLLAIIISSSFIIFLILIGIIGRYYIYPIDHNTNQIFSYPLRAFLHMLVICVSIAATASAAVLWNKKQNAMEARQIQNMEGSTPAGSPDSWFYNADRELESLPHQSLFQATNVHYGERPDLKRMLFEYKGSSVGVLVCGPKKMRHEVARICSSGLADNLHFESISFSW
ncbi:Ferric reduction oxidase [Melia azedarach]|uniref:Ferric reduction oxidase n=1 Tax=Melia azedarach TaxID=155640 RepID=A0ACC1YYE4_MELAZ|nr:Ferric reduction oxidase [Melia azedarach]